jgi:hypothetical protein
VPAGNDIPDNTVPNNNNIAAQQQQGSKLTVQQWVGIVSGVVTGVVALIAGAYAIWKWHHKHKLLVRVSGRHPDCCEYDTVWMTDWRMQDQFNCSRKKHGRRNMSLV